MSMTLIITDNRNQERYRESVSDDALVRRMGELARRYPAPSYRIQRVPSGDDGGLCEAIPEAGAIEAGAIEAVPRTRPAAGRRVRKGESNG